MTVDISEVEDLDDLLLLPLQRSTYRQARTNTLRMRLDATDLRYVTPDEFRVLQAVSSRAHTSRYLADSRLKPVHGITKSSLPLSSPSSQAFAPGSSPNACPRSRRGGWSAGWPVQSVSCHLRITG